MRMIVVRPDLRLRHHDDCEHESVEDVLPHSNESVHGHEATLVHRP